MNVRGIATGVVALLLAACSSAAGANSVSSESDFTSGDGGAEDTGVAPVEVPSYAAADATLPAKIRWSVDGKSLVEGLQSKVEIVRAVPSAPTNRRFKLQAVAPASAGDRGVVFEFGRGAAFVEPGVYECAHFEVVVQLIHADGSRDMTVLAPTEAGVTPPRACTVTIEQALEFDYSLAPVEITKPASNRAVTGRVEADVGSRDDASSPTHHISAAFAAAFIENKTL